MRTVAVLLLLVGACGSSPSDEPPDADPLGPPDGGSRPPDGAVEVPSRQTVTFRYVNAAGGTRWVAHGGWLCVPSQIERLDGPSPGVRRMPAQHGYCPCECPPPGHPGADRLVEVGPGGSVDLTWDGRVLHAEDDDTCATYLLPAGVARPAEPGRYRITTATFPALAASCAPQGDEVVCERPYSHGVVTGAGTELCGNVLDPRAPYPEGNVKPVTAELDLPETGDLLVTLTIAE